MKFNPKSTVRTAIYTLSVFVNATVAVLMTSDVVLSPWVLAPIAGLNAVVAFMAGANVNEDLPIE